MDISINLLFNILSEENKTGEVLDLANDFYPSAYSELSKLEENTDAAQQAKNFKKLLDTIKTKRFQKILLYVAYNKQIEVHVPKEEQTLYKEALTLIGKHSQQINSNEQIQKTKMKITSDLPELLVPNKGKIGPFKQDQVVELADIKEVEFLSNNKLATILQ